MFSLFRCFLWTALMVFVLSGTTTEAATKTVAVMPLEDVSGYSNKYVNVNPAEIMTEELTTALYKSGRYTIIERSKMDLVLKEIGFQLSGAVDPSRAVEVGKLLGAQYVVIGKVTMAKTSSNGNMFALSLKSVISRFQAKVAFHYRIVDVQTGEIKFLGDAKGTGSGDGGRDAALYEACQKAAQSVLRELQIDVRARIAKVSGDKIYIDGGSKLGFSKGESLIVFREISPIEINGKIVGMKEVAVGTAKVTEVNDEYSVCKVTSHSDMVKKGDVVKRTQKKK